MATWRWGRRGECRKRVIGTCTRQELSASPSRTLPGNLGNSGHQSGISPSLGHCAVLGVPSFSNTRRSWSICGGSQDHAAGRVGGGSGEGGCEVSKDGGLVMDLYRLPSRRSSA